MASTPKPHALPRVVGFWAGISAIPIVLGLLWYALRHWGWWKLRRQGNRRPLVRTWHGWVESSDDNNRRERNRLSKPRPRVMPRTTRSDYSWVFWDPTGERRRGFEQEREESLVRYLPQWMRSSAFGSADPNPNPNCDVEAARSAEAQESDRAATNGYLDTLSLLGRNWRQGWRKARMSVDSSSTHGSASDQHSAGRPPSCTSAAIEDHHDSPVGTVRLRHSSRQTCSGWQANSEDVQRATNTQLLAPTASFILASLFRKPSGQQEYDVERQDRPQAVDDPAQPAAPMGLQRVDHPTIRPLRNTSVMGSSYNFLGLTQSRRSFNKAYPATLNAICPPRPSPERIRAVTYGVENMRPRRWSASAPPPHPPPPVEEAPDDRSLDGDSDGEWPIRYQKSRGEVDDGTAEAEAERMSMIDVPGSWDARAYEDEGVDGLEEEGFFSRSLLPGSGYGTLR